ncbi:MAG: hypothetical protein IKL22_00050 [Lachnospiraceae bacterium]|nr:hypothetical protein [Lachnospiraceae bacterium]
MRSKKGICAVLLLTLIFALTSCGEKKRLVDHGMEVVELIEEAINSKEYVMIYSASEQITRVIEEVAEGDFSELEAVYSIRIDEDDLLEMADVDLDDMPESLQKVMKSKMAGSVANMINARSGAEKLATSSIISMGKTFAFKEEVENQIYLYIFEDAKPIMVSFVAGEDKTVSAGGTVIFVDDFECDSADDVEDLLREYDADVEEVDF